MQEAGEPLRLTFKKHHYGPYAENLRHVLNAIEGHLIAGYGDGGDSPDKEISLVPGAVADSQKFLCGQNETLTRFDKVSDLVSGFETPFGLELLATVHWTIKFGAPSNREELVKKVYAWNERKKQFSNRQISIALDTLVSKGWVQNLKTE